MRILRRASARALSPLLLFFVLGACKSSPITGDGGSKGPFYCEMPVNEPGAVVPDGFCIRRFAKVKTPRTLAFAPNGDLFVGSPSRTTAGGAPAGLGGLYVLSDDDHDGVADATRVYLEGPDFATVHGVLVTGGKLYYTLEFSVMALPYTSGDRTIATGAMPELIADLSDPGASDRFTHTLAVDAAGQLYTSRGQFDNAVCPPPNPRGGAVLRIGPGHDPHGDVVLRGARNPMYVNCAPWGCYAAELTGDSWGGIGGEEKLLLLRDGDDIGYPCCVGRNRPAPGITPAPDCSRASEAVQGYKVGDTPFGFDFDLKNVFPAPYTGGIFIGFHGAVGTWVGTGLRFAPIDAATHLPTTAARNFVTGWGQQAPVKGRIADVRFAPDGRLFFSDDQNGGIYWVAPTTLRRPGQ